MAKKSVIARSQRTPKFKSRSVSRCFRCGRKRGYMRDFDLCRICFREYANEGKIPGVKKIIMVGDPIGDMITRIKNASMAGIDSVSIPFSNIKFEIANVLKNEGYIKSVEIIGKDKSPVVKKLEIGIAYFEKPAVSSESRKPKVQGVERISKLSRRVYTKSRELGAFGRKKGIVILSSTSGIITAKTAKEKGLGGEPL